MMLMLMQRLMDNEDDSARRDVIIVKLAHHK